MHLLIAYIPQRLTIVSVICALAYCACASAGYASDDATKDLPLAYVAVPLGTLGGLNSEPRAINSRGDVTGLAYVRGDSTYHAFVYTNGSMADLGAPTGGDSMGTAINDAGAVALVSSLEPPLCSLCVTWFAYRYANGALLSLNPGVPTEVTGINGAGWITGSVEFAGGFVWKDGVFGYVDSRVNGDHSVAAINASGQITGSLFPDDLANAKHAFLGNNGVVTDLGTLGGTYSYGYAINDLGDVTGTSAVSDSGGPGAAMHAFLYSGGSMHDLGPLDDAYANTIGEGINDNGTIVGRAGATVGAGSRAFIYASGAIHDLTAMVVSGLGSAVLFDAYAINETGQIAAVGCGAIGNCQAFRLDPIAEVPTPPPPVDVIEYYHQGFDHYFMTASPTEIAALDDGAFQGWHRTGQLLKAYSTAVVGAEPVCRLFNDSFAPKSTHFYSADPDECLFTRNNPGWAWQFEGITMYIPTPDSQGTCPAKTQPVYRLYNNGMGGAPNHRYTTSTSIRDQMIGQGWVSEGYGAAGVIMCAPQ